MRPKTFAINVKLSQEATPELAVKVCYVDLEHIHPTRSLFDTQQLSNVNAWTLVQLRALVSAPYAGLEFWGSNSTREHLEAPEAPTLPGYPPSRVLREPYNVMHFQLILPDGV